MSTRRFKMVVVDRATGVESECVVSAPDASQAERTAQQAGFITGRPIEVEDSPTSALAGARKGTRPRRGNIVVLSASIFSLAIAIVWGAYLLSARLGTRPDPHADKSAGATSPTVVKPDERAPSFGLGDRPTFVGPGSAESASVEAASDRSGISEDATVRQVLELDGRYFSVPIRGTIGEDVLASGISACINEAKKLGCTHIQFEIDSPGGLVAEAMEILQLLAEARGDLVFVARVKRAISASMVFVVGSRHIIVDHESVLGGAVAYSGGMTTGSAEVDAKANSIWGASLASSAQSLGHSPAVVWAMVVREKSLYRCEDQGGKGFRITDSPCASNSRMLDGPESVLTLDGRLAIDIGFAMDSPSILSNSPTYLEAGEGTGAKLGSV